MIAIGRRRRGFVVAAVSASMFSVSMCCASIAAWSPVSAADETARSEVADAGVRWYALSLDGRPCGRARIERAESGDRRRVVEEMEMGVARDGTEVRIEIRLETVETAAGRLLEASRRFAAGAEPSTTRWTFEEGAVRETREEGGRQVSRTIELDHDAVLSPESAAAFFAERRSAGAARASWTTVSFEQGFEIVGIEATRLGEAVFRWGDRPVPVERWRLESTGTPFPVEEWWSGDGLLVESRVSTGLGDLVVRLASEEKAAAWRRGGLTDIVAATVVPLAGRLPADAEEIRLQVRARPGVELPMLPTTSRQRFELVPAGAVAGRPGEPGASSSAQDGEPPIGAEGDAENEAGRVGVLTIRPRGPDFGDFAEAPPGASHLAGGPLIEIDDDLVRRLAFETSGTAAEGPAASRAERLRRFVRSWIRRKDLATALAGAAEVARSRSGDCTEHATLLAALLRVHGIPARIAVGLVHADRFAGRRNVFAWHAWTQGFVDGVWVDLDATAAGAEDGVRVAVAFGDLAGGAFDPVWSATLPVMGAIEIAVLEDVGGGDSTTKSAAETP